MVKVFAPATIANLTVGFDSLGLALKPIDGTLLGDVVTVEALADGDLASHLASKVDAHLAKDNLIDIKAEGGSKVICLAKGSFVNELPKALEDNLVFKAVKAFARAFKKKTSQPLPSIIVTLEKNMPIGSGLGSSSCSTVATLVALNKFVAKTCKEELSAEELLFLMGEMEGSVSGSVHYDNVAPAFLGGLQLLTVDPQSPSQALPVENLLKDFYFVVSYPGIVIKTADARNALPDSYSKADIIAHGINFANFVHALYQGDLNLLVKAMEDKIAEPYREHLLPNYEEVKNQLAKAGVLKAGISGSGPTVYALCDSLEKAQAADEVFKQFYWQNDLAFSHICQINLKGAEEVA